MAATFDKKQIVSSTDLVRSFGKYLEGDLCDHDIFIFKRNNPEAVLVAYERYEQIRKQLRELKELLEHVAIYEVVEERKAGSEKKISLERLKKQYGL